MTFLFQNLFTVAFWIFLKLTLFSLFLKNWHINPLTSFCPSSFPSTNPHKLLMRLIINMRFHLTEGNWQYVSRARSALSASLSKQNEPFEGSLGNPACSTLLTTARHSVVTKYPRGPQKCVCGCNSTVLFPSLMSHQRTQCACACFKLEYISTSACRVVLDLQKVEWGWDYTVRTFVRVFVMMLDSLRLSDNFILVSKACKATKTINYDYFSLRFGSMRVNSIKQRLLQRRNPHFHINDCLLCYSGSLIEITQLFTVSAHF